MRPPPQHVQYYQPPPQVHFYQPPPPPAVHFHQPPPPPPAVVSTRTPLLSELPTPEPQYAPALTENSRGTLQAEKIYRRVPVEKAAKEFTGLLLSTLASIHVEAPRLLQESVLDALQLGNYHFTKDLTSSDHSATWSLVVRVTSLANRVEPVAHPSCDPCSWCALSCCGCFCCPIVVVCSKVEFSLAKNKVKAVVAAKEEPESI